MAQLDDFSKYVVPYAKGTPVPTVRDAVRQAIVELCMRSRVWRHELTGIAVGTTELSVPVPTDTQLYEFESVRFDGDRLCPTLYSTLDDMWPDWRTDTGQPKYFTQRIPGLIMTVPKQAGTLDMTIFLRPSEQALTVPDFFLLNYAKIISYGALGKILAIPGQPFSNPDLAAFNINQFEMQLDMLSSASERGQQAAYRKTRSSFF